MDEKCKILAQDNIEMIRRLIDQYQNECERLHSGRYTENIEQVMDKFINWLER